MTNNIKKELNQSSKIGNSISQLIINNKTFGNTEKQSLFLAYFDISGEHLKAIQLLIINDCSGSAFALVRTFYEAFFRAFWMNAYASTVELEKIINDEFKFDNMSKRIDQLDNYYTKTTFFKDLKDGVWKIMSDFTHSGSKQLSRRWKDSKLQSDYKESEILEVIIEITKVYLLFAYMLFQIHKYKKESDETFDIYCKYKENTDLILKKFIEVKN